MGQIRSRWSLGRAKNARRLPWSLCVIKNKIYDQVRYRITKGHNNYMKVNTDIKKIDLIRFNLIILPRLKSSYIMILAISLLVFTYITWTSGLPQSSKGWLGIFFSSVAGGVIGLLCGFVFSMVSILFMSSKNNGILGKHEYTLTPEGLYEETKANNGLSKWEGINKVYIVSSYILFQISGYLFHIVPKSSFESSEAFNKYATASIEYWRTAHNKAFKRDAK